MGAQYIECSAKQNNGVNEVFQVAVELAVARGLTLCGFARAGSMRVYAGDARVGESG